MKRRDFCLVGASIILAPTLTLAQYEQQKDLEKYICHIDLDKYEPNRTYDIETGFPCKNKYVTLKKSYTSNNPVSFLKCLLETGIKSEVIIRKNLKSKNKFLAYNMVKSNIKTINKPKPLYTFNLYEGGYWLPIGYENIPKEIIFYNGCPT